MTTARAYRKRRKPAGQRRERGRRQARRGARTRSRRRRSCSRGSHTVPGAARSGGGCGAAGRRSRSRRIRSPERCIGTACPLRPQGESARVRLGSAREASAVWTPRRGRTGVRAQVPLKVVGPGGGVLAAGEGAHVHHRHCEPRGCTYTFYTPPAPSTPSTPVPPIQTVRLNTQLRSRPASLLAWQPPCTNQRRAEGNCLLDRRSIRSSRNGLIW